MIFSPYCNFEFTWDENKKSSTIRLGSKIGPRNLFDILGTILEIVAIKERSTPTKRLESEEMRIGKLVHKIFKSDTIRDIWVGYYGTHYYTVVSEFEGVLKIRIFSARRSKKREIKQYMGRFQKMYPSTPPPCEISKKDHKKYSPHQIQTT